MTGFVREDLLEEGEFIVEKIRKHWIVYLQDFFLHTLGAIIFLVSAYYLESKGSFNGMLQDGTSYGAMILIMFVLIFWVSFFYAWTKNYFDVWYVTNEHIIAINQRQMFDREESFMELNRIQDVFFDRVGLFGTMWDFGRLRVQSAGTEQEFIIENVAHVEDEAHRIMELRDEKKKQTVSPSGDNGLGEAPIQPVASAQ